MDLGSVSGFWMNGRPSGLPENIEDQLAEAKRMQLVDPLESEKESVTSQKEAYTTLNTTISNLAQASDVLDSEQIFDVRTATSSDETVAAVNADSGAAVGTSSLDVTQIAKKHNLIVGIDDGVSDNGKTLGISDPNDSSLIADSIDISFSHGGESYSYTTNEDTTLNGIAQVIHTEDNGVTATVSNVGTEDAPEYVLQLKSDTTGGGDQRITDPTTGDPGICITDADENPASLFLDADGNPQTNEVDQAQAGQNAQFTVDGVYFERSSNTVDDVAQGLTLTLQGKGESSIAVSKDYSGAANSIKAFVQAFNQAKEYIGLSTSYDQEDDSAGQLLGSSIANSLERKMNNLVLSQVQGAGSQSFQYLSEIGVRFERDGTLSLDEDVLQSALNQNAQGVEDLFVGEGGVAKTMEDTLKDYTRSGNGTITYKLESLDRKASSLDERIEDAEGDVENYLERLVSKYTAMEQSIQAYKSVQQQLDSYTEQWKNMYK